MNFVRKLKLNNLGEYDFTQREIECLNFIKNLDIDNLNYKNISFLYNLMNLSVIRSNLNSNYLYFKLNNKIYFQFIEKEKFLYFDSDTYHTIRSLFKLQYYNLEQLIEKLIQKSYNFKLSKIVVVVTILEI